LKEFGVKPRIGWQIDPFGHSNTNARLFAEMGFDAWFFARVDQFDKQKRESEITLEYVHEARPEARILSHILWNHYEAPSGFSWDMMQGDPGWINDPSSTDYNAPDRAA